MNYHNLIVTQSSFRYNPKDSHFSEEPITLVKTEDSVHYIWNGHHRLAYAFMRNIEFGKLKFETFKYTYKELSQINFQKGYVTPFDPRVFVRIGDFKEFKEKVIAKYKEYPTHEYPFDAYRMIDKENYLQPRTIRYIWEMKWD